MSLQNTLTNVGISSFGIAMPLFSPRWTINSKPTQNDNLYPMALRLSTTNDKWVAPLAGVATPFGSSANTQPLGVTLIQPDGIPVNGTGTLLTLFPQLHLRLARLYAAVLEQNQGGNPVRPVPRYFLYKGATVPAGQVDPGDELDIGELSVYDSDGLPIDPIAVAAVFKHLMDQHKLLQFRNPSSSGFNANSQVKEIADLAGTPSEVRVRLSDFSGRPFSNNKNFLIGISGVATSSGLFTLKAASGSGSDLTGTVTKADHDGNSGPIPKKEHRLLKLGAATNGRLGESFSPPAGSSGLKRDFFSLRIVALEPYLIGNPNPNFNGSKAQNKPPVRINEPLNFLLDGNDILGEANRALTAPFDEALCVAQAIEDDFSVPDEPGDPAHWPQFPDPQGNTTVAYQGALPVDLRDQFEPVALLMDENGTKTDINLSLNHLPVGAAVRVFIRKFIEDAQEARGDGAGGVVPNTGKLTFIFKNPFALKSGRNVPSDATFRFDVMIVKNTGEARLYGNVETDVAQPPHTPSPPVAYDPGSNSFKDTQLKRGVCNAAVLGLGEDTATGPDFASVVLELTGEANPRDAPRFPSMTRRDLLVAGLANQKWRAVLAGGRLTKETHGADPRRGAPGGPGGRETQVTGVSSQNGRLAYDMARMAQRRTSNMVSRLIDLADNHWKEPEEPSPLVSGTEPTEDAGTFAGAVLQTIAPYCESPELSLFKSIVDPNPTAIPKDFASLIQWVINQINNGNHSNSGIQSAWQALKKQLQKWQTNPTGAVSKNLRIAGELRRELMSAVYGRRDAQWALEAALGNARHFVYIESPGLMATIGEGTGGSVPAYAVDLISMLNQRIGQAPGLHVMFCVPKAPYVGTGYEQLAVEEVADRLKIFNGPTPLLPNARSLCFHPVGFPGRNQYLESTVVIVDDIWAMVGSSTFRRRGLTFDGGSDLVFTDMDLQGGRSHAIAQFRRHLMAQRLGVHETVEGKSDTLRDPTFALLNDGVEAFYAIRESLRAGGHGKIKRLWHGKTPYVDQVPSGGLQQGVYNPEGQKIGLAALLAMVVAAETSTQ